MPSNNANINLAALPAAANGAFGEFEREREPLPRHFHMRKRGLIAVMAIAIVLWGVAIFYSDNILADLAPTYVEGTSEYITAKRLVIGCLIGAIILGFVFLYGLVKQNYPIVVLFLVSLVIATITAVWQYGLSIVSLYCGSGGAYLSVIGYLYMVDVRNIHNHARGLDVV